jgi:MscS family membrane protein
MSSLFNLTIPDQILVQSVISGVLILVYFLASALKNRLIHGYGRKLNYTESYTSMISKIIGVVIFFLWVVLISLVWGVGLQSLYVFSTGLLAFVGVGLFAVWSMLSNITAGVIIFFQFPFTIGDKIDFVELPDVGGEIVDITLFNMILEGEDGETISVPNNTAIQQVIRVIERTHKVMPDIALLGIGSDKNVEFETPEDVESHKIDEETDQDG